MLFTGTLYKIWQERKPSDKFTVKEFILDMTEDINGRPNVWYLGCQITNKNIEKLDEFKVGDKITIDASVGSYNTFTKDGEEKVINNVTAFRIKSAEKANSINAAVPVPGEDAPW